MKILQVCAAYKPAYIYGGPTMSVSMLSESLVSAGVETEVYATTANGKKELDVPVGKKVEVDRVGVTYFKRLTRDHSHYSPQLFSKLKREANGFDLVHIHAWWNLVSLFSCAIATGRNVPVLLSPRGTLSAYSFGNKNIGIKWLIHRLVGKRLLEKCFIHVTSEREREAVAALFTPKRITVIPNFVKLPTQKTYPARELSEPFRLIFFSRIEEKKGLDLLIKALSALTVPYTLTVAGDGEVSYVAFLKKLAAEYGVTDKITWIGFQNENKFEILEEHDLFILPSHDENFGNVVVESLSVGTPVLVSEGVGLSDYIKANEFGWVCSAEPESIAQAINNIFVNRPQLEHIRRKAPGRVYADFTGEHLTRRYIDVYQQLIEK